MQGKVIRFRRLTENNGYYDFVVILRNNAHVIFLIQQGRQVDGNMVEQPVSATTALQNYGVPKGRLEKRKNAKICMH